MSSCHLPMVQLLIEGWNPVTDPTMADILASLDLDVWDMAPLHVAFMPKTLAVFSAVAYSFVDDPRALTFPLPAFLWLGVLLTAMRLFRCFPKWALVSALIGVLPLVAWQMPVDLGIAYASCGLLLTMQEALRKGNCDWPALTIWGAWMALVKPNGAFGFLVFFLVFAVVAFCQKRMGRKQLATRSVTCLAFIAFLATIVLWNPLGTSWRTFGHPLYPLRTVDAEHFPVKDLTWDLDVGNDDFKKMGKVGRIAHAYLSPQATIAFYRWKFEQTSFEPDAISWAHSEYPKSSVRVGLMAMFAVLFLLRSGRPWAVAGMLILCLVPSRYTGYTRYMPWLSSLGCLTIAFAAEWAEAKLPRRVANGVTKAFAVETVLLLVSWAWNQAMAIECASAEFALVREEIHPRFSTPQETVRKGSPFDAKTSGRVDQLTYRDNQCRLLVKELGQEAVTKVVSAYDWMPQDILSLLGRGAIESGTTNATMNLLARTWGDRSRWESNRPEVMTLRMNLRWRWTKGWIRTPFGYYVPDDEDACFLHDYYDEEILKMDISEWAKFVVRANTVFHAWFVTYPKEVWRRLAWKR
jgi:hypothetical protein